MKACRKCGAVSPDDRTQCFLCRSREFRRLGPAVAFPVEQRPGKAGDFFRFAVIGLVVMGFIRTGSRSPSLLPTYIGLVFQAVLVFMARNSENKAFRSFLKIYLIIQAAAGFLIVALIAMFIYAILHMH